MAKNLHLCDFLKHKNILVFKELHFLRFENICGWIIFLNFSNMLRNMNLYNVKKFCIRLSKTSSYVIYYFKT
jgi:hypothetical protein